MINGKRIAVVMPAYNAEKTLEATVGELPDLVDIRILVDDHSPDQTVELARRLGLLCLPARPQLRLRPQSADLLSRGAGRAAPTWSSCCIPTISTRRCWSRPWPAWWPTRFMTWCWARALSAGTALRGGMPLYKYISNRLLTAFENLFLRVKLSEYHTGYRAFSRKVLTELPLLENSDDFVFDNQMLAQCVHFGFRIGEVSCPTKYFEEASSINFRRSVKYGFGVLATTLQFALQRAGLIHLPRFSDKGRKLEPGYPTYYARRTARPA